jgi:anthranilate synthase/aminodeoxychorismate synthase-like glutamine amidotransferase
VELIRHFTGKLPILGVCLGHQAIGEAFGAKVVRAKKLMHGKISKIEHDARSVFRDLPTPLTAMRYHSLVVSPENLPKELEVTAHTSDSAGDKVIMGLRHRGYPIEGVQFHPESVLTQYGKQMLRNFLAL